jgi:hypothetical protein
MKLFAKKEEKETSSIVFPPKRFNKYKKFPLGAILKSILDLGEKDDYEYLLRHAAKVFFSENSIYLERTLVKSDDDLEIFVEFINYFLAENDLGDMKMAIDEESRKIMIYHYNSPFLSIYEEDFFLEEFYKLLMEMLLNREVKFEKREEDEVQIFVFTTL